MAMPKKTKQRLKETAFMARCFRAVQCARRT
jgi:hypothetical protein